MSDTKKSDNSDEELDGNEDEIVVERRVLNGKVSERHIR